MEKITAKTMFIFLFSILILSCSDDFGQQDWIIELKMVTQSSPSVSGYPTTTYSTIEKLGITSKQADEIVIGLNQKTTSKYGGYTITITTTAMKYLKSKYKPRPNITTTTITEKF
jgi:hypothetical protein